MMVRDEEDVIGRTIGHLLAEGVDLVIVADNLSTDGTRDILEGFDDRVMILEDPTVGYYQADKMTRLAAMAYGEGADWVLPCDADEIFYDPAGATLAERFADADPRVGTVEIRGWDHIATRADIPGHPFDRITHRRPEYQTFPKVAFRAHPDAKLAMGNHSVECPGIVAHDLAYRHFQYRSLKQMTRKLRNGATAYEATNLPDYEGAHWRQGGNLTEVQLSVKWDELCSEEGLVFDPAPVKS